MWRFKKTANHTWQERRAWRLLHVSEVSILLIGATTIVYSSFYGLTGHFRVTEKTTAGFTVARGEIRGHILPFDEFNQFEYGLYSYRFASHRFPSLVPSWPQIDSNGAELTIPIVWLLGLLGLCDLLIRRRLRRKRDDLACPECGYDLRRSKSQRCSECGAPRVVANNVEVRATLEK